MAEAQNSPSIVAKRHGDDCLPCRLVSGFGVIGIGVYLYSTGTKQSNKISRAVLHTLALGKTSMVLRCKTKP